MNRHFERFINVTSVCAYVVTALIFSWVVVEFLQSR